MNVHYNECEFQVIFMGMEVTNNVQTEHKLDGKFKSYLL